MKPVLHFEIDKSKRHSVEEVQNIQQILSTLRERLSGYEIIVSPMHLKEGGINIPVDVNSSTETTIREVEKEIIQHELAFHQKYMPDDVRQSLIYDASIQNIAPLDMMRQWWYPVIEMVNYSIYHWNDRVLEILISQDINPLQVGSIRDANYVDGIEITMNDIVPDADDIDDVPVSLLSYFHWMLKQINTSKVATIDIYRQIKCAGCNPWLVVSCEDNDGGFPFQIIDENLIIKHSIHGHIDNEVYLLAAKERQHVIVGNFKPIRKERKEK